MTVNADVDPALLDELVAIRSELAVLRAKVAAMESEHTDETPQPEVSSRRRLLARAGGVAAAVVAGSAVVGGQRAAALNGDAIQLANNNVSDSASVISTFVNYSVPTTNPNNRHLFVVGDSITAFSPTSDKTAAVSGYASKTVQAGVSGVSTISGGKGVYGYSTTGFGVHADSDQNVSLFVGGDGRALFAQAAAAGPPTTGTFSTGELVRDANADFWVCTSGGVNAGAGWKQLAFANSQLHVIDPTRVFDSRLPSPGTKLAGGASRTISVANGIDLTTGAVSTPNVVPAGATAVQFTLTVTGASSTGFLAATPGGSASFKASTINWTAGTPTLATGALCKLDGSRQIKMFAGGAGSTHFIVDITGYYL